MAVVVPSAVAGMVTVFSNYWILEYLLLEALIIVTLVTGGYNNILAAQLINSKQNPGSFIFVLILG